MKQQNFQVCQFLPNDLVLKLLGLPPGSETGETEAVIAARHDAEPGLGLWLLHDDLHADAAGPVLGAGYGESQLHVGLQLTHAVLKEKNHNFIMQVN
jgi:hypothetical protein